MTVRTLLETYKNLECKDLMPALFVGHGSPMNGIEHNAFTAGWENIGETLPKPRAILVISAHWLTEGTFVHTKEFPKTIYDFYGFPEELYRLSYPAPGSPEYAKLTQEKVKKEAVTGDTSWGLDHGAWIVLMRMYPKADIPVYQLSLDVTKSAAEHYALAKELALLRKRGVLIMGSGNIVHNLRRIDFNPNAKAFDWAAEFDGQAKVLIEKHEHDKLIAYEKLGDAAALAIPTPDHYWPLLYTLAQQTDSEYVSFPVDGITHGSISMRSVLIS